MAEAATRSIELLQRLIEAVNRDGPEGVVPLVDVICHPDVEWAPAMARALEGRTYHGRDEVRAYLGEVSEAFEEIRLEQVEYRPVGEDVVVVLGRMVVRGRGSGVPAEHEIGIVCEFEDGLLRRWASHPSKLKALAAVSARDA